MTPTVLPSRTRWAQSVRDSDPCDQLSVNSHVDHRHQTALQWPYNKAHKFQRHFFILKEEINLLIPRENILGLFVLFIENFNNSFKMSF